MRIRIADIPEEGMQVSADSVKEVWLKALLIESFGQDKFKEDDNGRMNLHVVKNNRNIILLGGVILHFHSLCDRCLSIFKKQEQVTIHRVLLPAGESRHSKGKKDENVDDEDIGFYNGDEIDLSSIVRESVILAQDMVSLCSDSCKGLCQMCGKNLNKTPCGCRRKKETLSPFSVIKGIKVKPHTSRGAKPRRS